MHRASDKRMSAPVGNRAARAAVTVVAACSDSDVDLFLETSGVVSGMHMHAQAQQQQQQKPPCIHKPKRRSEPVGAPTALQAERRWLRHKMYGDHDHMHEVHAHVQPKRVPLQQRMATSATSAAAHKSSAKRFSEPSGRGLIAHASAPAQMHERARPMHLRASSPGSPPALSPAAASSKKRYSEPAGMHAYNALQAHSIQGRSLSPPPLGRSPPRTPFTHTPPNNPEKRASSPNNFPRKSNNHSQSNTRSRAPPHNTFTPSLCEDYPSAVNPAMHTHTQEFAYPINRTPTPEATQLRACSASPVDTAMHGRRAAPIARLFSQHSDGAWCESDTDNEDAYHACASGFSLGSIVASGVSGTPPRTALRPPARLRASSINVPMHTYHAFSPTHPPDTMNPTKQAQPHRAASDLHDMHAPQGFSPRDTTLKIREGAPSMATPRQDAPVATTPVGGKVGGNSRDLSHLCWHSMHSEAYTRSRTASLVNSSSDVSKLSAGSISSSKDACMLFMRASEQYPAPGPEEGTGVQHTATEKGIETVKGGSDDVAQHAEHAQRAKHTRTHTLSPARATGTHAHSNLAMHAMHASDKARETSFSPLSSPVGTLPSTHMHASPEKEQERSTRMHDLACRTQRAHSLDVVKGIFRQVLSLLEVSHAQDLFLGALHRDNPTVSWEQRGQSESCPRVHAMRVGYLHELAEPEVCTNQCINILQY